MRHSSIKHQALAFAITSWTSAAAEVPAEGAAGAEAEEEQQEQEQQLLADICVIVLHWPAIAFVPQNVAAIC